MGALGSKDDKELLDAKERLRKLSDRWEQEDECTVEDKQGVKHDAGKPRMSLVPMHALRGWIDVLEHGAVKYGAYNWKQGMEWTRLWDAAMRHMLVWREGQNTDSESGLHHLAHAMTSLSFLIGYMAEGLGEDDRGGG